MPPDQFQVPEAAGPGMVNFDVLADNRDSVFGPARKGEAFDFHGLIMYRLEDSKFADIKVAYHQFVFTGLDGSRKDLGIPH